MVIGSQSLWSRLLVAWEAFVSDLELSPIVHPMVYIEGTESET